jgi:hypothetical protein
MSNKALREGLKKEILDSINNSCFSLMDFNIEFPISNNEGSDLLKIRFTHNSEYLFYLRYYSHSANYSIIESPGQIQKSETQRLDNLKELPDKIMDWCERIKIDLKAKLNPIYTDELNKLKLEFETEINKFINKIPNKKDFFSSEEAEIYKEKVDSLIHRMNEIAEQLNINKEEILKANEEIEKVKQTIDILNKESWVKSGGSKIINTLGNLFKSNTGKALIKTGLKQLLLGEQISNDNISDIIETIDN